MIRAILLLTMMVLPGLATAQDKPAAEPAELVAKRNEHDRAVQRAVSPLLADYLRKLESLRAQYTREGKIEAALTVEKEIRKIKRESGARITIVSATYGVLDTKQTADIADVLRATIKDGRASIILSSFQGGLPRDPAPNLRKQTKVVYSIDGQRYEKTFKESYELKFDEDLR
jgi:hypothetical protein